MEYATRDQAQQAVSTLSNQNLMGRLVYVREVRFKSLRLHSSHICLDRPLESFLTLQGTDNRYVRTARPNLALPDRLQPAEATTVDRLEVAMVAVADSVEAVVATEALLHPVVDARSSSTMSVILTLFLIAPSELPLT